MIRLWMIKTDYSLHLMLMCGAAILDFSDRVRNLTSWGIPVNISDWEIENPEFPV